MADTLLKDALQHALENIKGMNLSQNSYATTVDVLNAFNDLYSCTVTFSITPNTAIVVVKDANGNTVTANQGGTYTLREGSYTYTVTATDYTTIADKALTISQSDVTTGTKSVSETMTRVNCVVTFTETNSVDIDVVVKNGTTVIEPDGDGDYHLPKASYTYTATAEGYTTQSDVALTIATSDVTTGTKTVTVTMVAVTP